MYCRMLSYSFYSARALAYSGVEGGFFYFLGRVNFYGCSIFLSELSKGEDFYG